MSAPCTVRATLKPSDLILHQISRRSQRGWFTDLPQGLARLAVARYPYAVFKRSRHGLNTGLTSGACLAPARGFWRTALLDALGSVTRFSRSLAPRAHYAFARVHTWQGLGRPIRRSWGRALGTRQGWRAVSPYSIFKDLGRCRPRGLQPGINIRFCHVGHKELFVMYLPLFTRGYGRPARFPIPMGFPMARLRCALAAGFGPGPAPAQPRPMAPSGGPGSASGPP